MTRVIDVVGWRVDKPSPTQRGRRLLGTLASVVGELAAGTGAGPASVRRANPDVPADPEQQIDFGEMTIASAADWLRPYGGEAEVSCTPVEAVVASHWAGTRPVPLDDLRPVAVTPQGRRDDRSAWSRWTLELVDSDGGAVTLTGPMLGLAWVGHLAGWVEPPVRG